MSHTVSLELKIKDKELFKQVARQKGYRVEEMRFRLYSSAEKGLGVFLPGWRYPAVVTEEGELRYDNYNGRWGKQEVLDELVQEYAVQLVHKKALEQGLTLVSQKTTQGEVEIVLAVNS